MFADEGESKSLVRLLPSAMVSRFELPTATRAPLFAVNRSNHREDRIGEPLVLLQPCTKSQRGCRRPTRNRDVYVSVRTHAMVVSMAIGMTSSGVELDNCFWKFTI